MVFKERQARSVDVHGHSHRVGFTGLGELGKNSILIPGLHGGNAAAVGVMDGPEGALHDGGVHAVAGEGQDARVTAGGLRGLIPEAGLHLADVARADHQHTEPALADAAAHGQRQLAVQQHLVER